MTHLSLRLPRGVCRLAACLLSAESANGATVVAGPGEAGLRAAIQAAQPGDTVEVTGAITLQALVRVEKRLTIRTAASVTSPVSIGGTFAGEMFQAAADGIIFERLTFAGSAQTDGLRVEKNVVLRDCTIQHTRQPVVQDYEVSPPAVVRLERVKATLNEEGFACVYLEAKDSTFSHNGNGGAYPLNGWLEGCVFENNPGAGLSLINGTVKNCVFRFNAGFGLYFDPDPGILNLSGSLFYENDGGGLLLGEEAVASVDNCTFTRHTGPPAVIVSEVREALFRHCTVADNLWAEPGALPGNPDGAAFVIGFLAERVELQNCLVADNPEAGAPHAPGLLGTWTDGGGNTIGGDANLGALADNGGPTQTLLPLGRSPAINAGRASDLFVDARGLSRQAGPKPDAGAVETGAAAPADADADQLPDTWEHFHGMNPANPADAASDADGDGQPARAEFTSRTDPVDSKSVFRIESITPVTDFAVTPALFLQLRHFPGVMFHMESSTDLRQWNLAPGSIRPSGRQNGYQMLGFEARGEALRSYYRVAVKEDPFD